MQFLLLYFQEALKIGYNKCKELAMIGNENGAYSSFITPKILITLLHDIRNESRFYEELNRKCPDLHR